MADTTAFDRLARLSDQLLGAHTTPQQHLDAAWDLHAHLTSLAALSSLIPSERTGAEFQETETTAGVAIAPFEAAMCLREHQRSRQFGLGVQQAIKTAQARFPGTRLRVLYAGTGPFATLATFQLPYFGADEVGFTFLDIHQASGDATRRVYQYLNALDYVDDWVTADAGTYRPDRTFHVIIAEVLQRGLTREPQVQVTRNLARYLAPGGVFVPEEIQLDLAICDPRPIFRQDEEVGALTRVEPARIQVGTVFSLTAETARELSIVDGAIPLDIVTAPAFSDPDMILNIFTRIKTNGDLWLNEMDCSLNLVVPAELDPSLKPGESLDVSYRIGERPGLEFKRRHPISAAAESATENQMTEMKARM